MIGTESSTLAQAAKSLLCSTSGGWRDPESNRDTTLSGDQSAVSNRPTGGMGGVKIVNRGARSRAGRRSNLALSSINLLITVCGSASRPGIRPLRHVSSDDGASSLANGGRRLSIAPIRCRRERQDPRAIPRTECRRAHRLLSILGERRCPRSSQRLLVRRRWMPAQARRVRLQRPSGSR